MKEAALALAYADNSFITRQQLDARYLRYLVLVAVVLTVLCILPFLAILAEANFSTIALGALQPGYSLFAWTTAIFLGFAAIPAVAHFTIEPEDWTTPLVGIGLLACGIIDGNYAWLVQQQADIRLIETGWWLSRSFSGAIVILLSTGGLALLKWGKYLPVDYRELVVVLSGLVLAAIAVGGALFWLYQPRVEALPGWLPTLLLLIAAPLLLKLFMILHSLLVAALLLMLIPGLALELHMLFGASQQFDSHSNIAIALRWLMVLMPAAGMLCHYIFSYRTIAGARRELVANQRKLDVALETLTSSNERLMHANSHDHLTGVANREFFFAEAERAIARARRSKQRVGFLYLDLDKFKQVNDAFGHSVGDEVLCCFAERIGGVMRREDCLARVGGDEFVLMVENVGEVEQLSTVADKIMELLRAPVQTAKGELDVAVSIGISVFPETTDIADLVKHADIAMYEAKANETSKFQVYTRELNNQYSESLALQRELPEALQAGQFSLAFQPVFDTPTGKPVGVEALLRWNHPEKGAISPVKFIAIAEKSTFINSLGNWAFEQACQQLACWREQHNLSLVMAVNVSVRQLYTGNLATTISRCLSEYSIPASAITLEITEGQLIQDLQACQGTIAGLKTLGVNIALDDYGSGFASITHLRNLPIDFLKIDRSLIRNAPNNLQNRVLTRTTIELAHSLNLPVVAEGIEEAAELQLINEYSCDFVQGFYLARPMAADQCTEFLLAALESQQESVAE